VRILGDFFEFQFQLKEVFYMTPVPGSNLLRRGKSLDSRNFLKSPIAICTGSFRHIETGT